MLEQVLLVGGEAWHVERDQGFVDERGQVLLERPGVAVAGGGGAQGGVAAEAAADEVVEGDAGAVELAGEVGAEQVFASEVGVEEVITARALLPS